MKHLDCYEWQRIKIPKYQKDLQTADVRRLRLDFAFHVKKETYQLLLRACHFTYTHKHTHMPGCVFTVRLGVKIEIHTHSNRHHLLTRNVFGESSIALRSVAILREKDDTEHYTGQKTCAFRRTDISVCFEGLKSRSL